MKCFLLISFLFLFSGLSTGYNTEFFHRKFQSNKSLFYKKLPWENISCKNDEECQSHIIKSKCTENFCKCTNDTILSSDASKCLPFVREYGASCEDNLQCSALLSTGGMCNNNECICKSGYHYLKGLCWKNIDLNEKCSTDEQCFSAYEYVGLHCQNSICKCRPKYRSRFNSGCRRERFLNETCNLDFDCVHHSTCESMRCTSLNVAQPKKSENSLSNSRIRTKEKYIDCQKGTFKYNDMCVLELGMKCSEHQECSHIENALCLDNTTCACEPALYTASEDNRKCLRVTRGKVEDIRKSSCRTNAECGVFGGNSFCQNRKCACKSKSYFEKKKKFCWAVKSLNESCVVDEDCNPYETHTECVKTRLVCDCQKGYHSKDSKCILDALKVGDPCVNTDDCLFPNSYCNASKTCTCKDNFYPENGVCKPGVGTSCSADADCAHLKNTECRVQFSSIKQCLCFENYTKSDDFKYCLPVIGFKEECEKSFQCKFPMGDQGECRNYICECPEEEHYFNGKCYKNKRIGETCLSQPECILNNIENSVICLKGICACNYDYKIDGSGFCVKTNSATTITFFSALLANLVVFLALIL